MRALLLPLAAALLVAAPASAEKKSYDIRDFTRIHVDTAFEIAFTQSPSWSVSVDSEYNNLDKVIVEKKGDALIVRRPDGVLHQRRIHDVVKITAPRLSEIDLHTAVKFSAGRLDASTLVISADTAAAVDVADLHADTLTIHGDSAASLAFKGTCNKLVLTLSAGSKADAHALECREAKVGVDAASSARVFASSLIDADARSASSIRIAGNPARVTEHKDMVSSVARGD